MKFFKIVFVFILLSQISTKTFSQCFYVTKENNTENRVKIPCSFPVLAASENLEQSQLNFQSDLKNWAVENPQLKTLDFTLKSYETNSYIEIPMSRFKLFSVANQTAIKGADYFYKIVNN